MKGTTVVLTIFCNDFHRFSFLTFVSIHCRRSCTFIGFIMYFIRNFISITINNIIINNSYPTKFQHNLNRSKTLETLLELQWLQCHAKEYVRCGNELRLNQRKETHPTYLVTCQEWTHIKDPPPLPRPPSMRNILLCSMKIEHISMKLISIQVNQWSDFWQSLHEGVTQLNYKTNKSLNVHFLVIVQAQIYNYRPRLFLYL